MFVSNLEKNFILHKINQKSVCYTCELEWIPLECLERNLGPGRFHHITCLFTYFTITKISMYPSIFMGRGLS